MKTVIQYPNRLVGTFQHYSRLIRTFSNWPVYLAFKFGWLKRKSIVLRTRSGLAIEVPWLVRHAFKDIFLYHTYVEPGMAAKLPEQPVVIDVGGNVGFFSLFALSLRPKARVYTFEPVGANFAQLQANRTRNPQADWRPFHAAVAGADGTVQLCTSGDNELTTAAFIQGLHDAPAKPTGTQEEVPACSLATVFAREGIERCDWLKLDCEGAEYDIIYNTPAALFERISAITLETHVVNGPRNNAAELSRHLEQLGYDLWVADDDVIYAVKRA